jgi:hypothetical protein
MPRFLAQTVFLFIAGCLFLTLDCQKLRAQGFTNAAPAAAATDAGTRTDKQLPDISGLVRECDLHGALMHRSLSEYTYTLVKVKRVLNDHNKVMRELVQAFEAYPIPGQHVLIQISENGTALSPREVAEERRLAGEELARAERDTQKRDEALAAAAAKEATAKEAIDNPGKYLVAGVSVRANGKYFNVLIDLSEFLRSCEFSNPRREMVGKREAIVLSFRSRAGVKFPFDMTFMSKLNGTIWIDAEDKVVARLEGWPLATTPPETKAVTETKAAPETKTAHEAQAARQSQDARQSEAAVIYQQVRLPTGVWVPSLIRMNAGGNGALFNGLNWDVMFEFSDYKRYSTDVEGVKLEKPKRHP